MNGPEVSREIQRLKPEIKVLYMSGHSPEWIARDTSLSDMQVLEKPFGPEVLLRRVGEMLGPNPATEARV